MDTYSFLRELADSWALLLLFLFFLGVFFWAWRPGSRPLHEDAAAVPFRYEEAPAPSAPALRRAGCANQCAACTCSTDALFAPERQS